MSGHHHHGHTLHSHQGHIGWNNSFPPVLTVAPGETIIFEVAEASGGQLSPTSVLADVTRLDFGKVRICLD